MFIVVKLCALVESRTTVRVGWWYERCQEGSPILLRGAGWKLLIAPARGSTVLERHAFDMMFTETW